jgi:hypothetical protein
MKRAGWFVGLLLLIAAIVAVIYVVRPRLYLLTFAAVGLLVVAVYCAVWFRKSRTVNLFVSVTAISLGLSFLDPFGVLAERTVTHLEGSWSDRYHYVWDDELGIVLPHNVAARARKLTNDHLDYDVTYTIDANGHRATTGSHDPDADNVIFLGCSFTFGQGLNDDQTLPQQFSTITGQRFNVINFGVPTYGLHQVTRILELGLPESFLKRGKRFIVYSAIADHARRAAAMYNWAARGPAYRVDSDGTATYRGNIYAPWTGYIITAASRSAFLSHYVLDPLLSGINFDPVPLYIALVKKAAALSHEKYHAQFIMVFWDDVEPYEPSARIQAELDKAKIPYVRVSSIIPDFLQKDSSYRVSPYDQHPNPLANRLIAEYLAKRIESVGLSE